jgi:hypothetical protein
MPDSSILTDFARRTDARRDVHGCLGGRFGDLGWRLTASALHHAAPHDAGIRERAAALLGA